MQRIQVGASALLSVFTVMVLAVTGCGGSPASLQVTETDSHSQPLLPGGPAADLPGIHDLPLPEHSASVLGPGWFEFQPLNKYYKVATWGATGLPGGGLTISGSGYTGWALFGVPNFDGDLSPTSVRVNTTAVSGNYYVAYSSYADGHWLFSGPFSASAEAEIPGTGNVVSPTSFISGSDVFYFAVIAEDTNSVDISTLEVGIHGGSEGPERPRNLYSGGGETQLLVLWDPSLSANDYDFAGYVLERAPLLFGDYLPVTPEVITDTWYLDTGVAENTQYRYRMYAVDNVGNRSNYRLPKSVMATAPSNPADPVAIIDCPSGPFIAPAQATFDLSRSFDPEGGEIDTYELRTIGISPLISSSSSFTQTLQPGCYILEATVRVGARFGTTKKTIKVLPAWESQSTEIYSSFGDLPRMEFIRSWLGPDGEPLHIGYDPTVPIISIWYREGDEWHYRPYGSGQGLAGRAPSYIGEPVSVGEACIVPVFMGDTVIVSSINSDSSQLVGFVPNFGNIGDEAVVVQPGPDTISTVFSIESGGMTDLYYVEGDTSFSPELIAANVGVITALDAVYNPGADATDIIYAEGANTNWLRFQPGAGVIGNATFGAFNSMSVDMELDLATGRPAVVHYLDMAPLTARYQLLNDDNATWGGAIDIDISDVNVYPGDLVINSQGTFYLGGLANGGNPLFNLYRLDGAVWTLRNSTSTVLGDATNITLIMDESTGDAFASGYDKNGVTHMKGFGADGSISEEWTLDAAAGFGRELHGTAGADGLHIIFSQADTGNVSHMADTGGGWTHLGNPFGPVTDLDLASTSLGEVYASFIDVNSVELHYWDGATWSMQQGYPGLAGYRPGLMDQPLQEVMNWGVYLWPANVLRYVSGSQSVPFAFTAVTPIDTPVWNCHVSSGGFLPTGEMSILAIAGDMVLEDADVGYFRHGYIGMSEILSSFVYSDVEELRGRSMETCPFELLTGTREAYWLPFAGENLNSLIVVQPGNEVEGPAMPFETEFQLFSSELRRTVSMAYARGGTAVALESDLTGQLPFFWWSNFGDWEAIPFPDDLSDGSAYMSMPELIVDADGRWHVVYHDYFNDRMMVRSTL